MAFLLHTYDGGGAERVIDTLAQQLMRRRGSRIYLLVYSTSEASVAHAAALGFTVVTLPHEQPYQSASTTQRVVELLRPLQVGALMVEVNTIARPELLRSLGCKIFFHSHTAPLAEVRDKLNAHRRSSALRRFFDRWRYERRTVARHRAMLAAVDGYVTLCPAYRDEMARLLGGDVAKICAIHNPLAIERFRVADRGDVRPKRVLYIGRLDFGAKRIDRLIDVWARLETQFPEWQLRVVGSGPMREEIDRRVGDAGLQRVELCSYSANPVEHYAEASILCLTSDHEGWPCVLLEGLAAGLRPIAFNCSAGVAEILADGRGVLVDPAGGVAAYAEALAGLMRGECEPAEGVDAFLSAFSVDKIMNQWLDLLA